MTAASYLICIFYSAQKPEVPFSNKGRAVKLLLDYNVKLCGGSSQYAKALLWFMQVKIVQMQLGAQKFR